MAVPPPTTILVIDDEPSLLRGVARVLRREGYTVATAANGRYALAQLQVQLYDVILSDLQMPDIDGRPCTCTLRIITTG
jgi:CheY-like chemotaxis protein